VDGKHDGLRPKFAAQLMDEIGSADGGCVDADLVGSGVQDEARVVDATDASADRERDKYLPRGACDDIDHRLPRIAGSGDVEKNELIGALIVIARRKFNGVARIAQIDKIYAFHDASTVDVETRNDALYKHAKFRMI